MLGNLLHEISYRGLRQLIFPGQKRRVHHLVDGAGFGTFLGAGRSSTALPNFLAVKEGLASLDGLDDFPGCNAFGWPRQSVSPSRSR